MKLQENERNNVICMLIMMACGALVFLAAIVSSCAPHRARANIPETELAKFKRQVCEQDELLRAYNHLLHRVWIDKPVYVEECLSETDEFIELDELLESNWEDTFSFYNDEDSIAYKINWENESPYDPGCTRVIKHIVIPEPSKINRSIFGVTSDE